MPTAQSPMPKLMPKKAILPTLDFSLENTKSPTTVLKKAAKNSNIICKMLMILQYHFFGFSTLPIKSIRYGPLSGSPYATTHLMSKVQLSYSMAMPLRVDDSAHFGRNCIICVRPVGRRAINKLLAISVANMD
jgi:hypothetical protein